MISIVEGRLEHAPFIGERMRLLDRRECEALGFTSPADAVQKCIAGSTMSFTAVLGGLPIAAWGYREDDMILADSAELWCLTTDIVGHHKRDILRYSRSFVAYVQRRHSRLVCLVSKEHRSAVRWLEWLGFDKFDEVTCGGTGFHVMRKTRIT